ncbi:vomeronasal type-1 receptor 90-like [Ictidomys tridecemlineatus]|uniref:vomeronasal type-1 receptor 90-like n=1 Tax=Ictidomys tridecemlineatus TaxID=43179 RepID=UPI00038C154A|nr:vomeronasal type-1 receptor 90-like [Ictidomys tridecemlineatus]KAG3295171.1 vomeronasal type-1 receptor 90-like [Ictidomys tridecemlineatus]
MTQSSTLYIFLAVRNAFCFQIVIGITANVFLLLFHVLTFLVQRRTRPTDVAVAHLALIHLLMLIIRAHLDLGITGGRDFWNDFTCQAVIYLYRLMRSLSVSTTCLLSVLQASTLSPRSSHLAKSKHTSPQCSAWTMVTLWVFNVFFNVRVLVSMGGPSNDTAAFLFVSESCIVTPIGHRFRTFFSVIGIIRDIFLMGLMALSSGYMVTLLCRHKRQCQHLHSTSLSPRTSPEMRATRTILLLMGIFVLMYFVDCVLSSTLGEMFREDPTRLGVQMLLGNGYATLSALILICAEKRIINFFQSTRGKERKCLPSAR